ncbi:MAG TPA: hypothetical protein VKH42_13050 [Vicinamibacterales bacterium]|nr:hypothetical protein [Vicinamibacterales bacterium]
MTSELNQAAALSRLIDDSGAPTGDDRRQIETLGMSAARTIDELNS